MFDILKAKESFMNYVRQFDLTNDKIHLKLVHTLEVVHTTEYLCHHENITGVERDLAYLIALLHDIGRFEQIKRFNSFDDRNIDHAKLGVQVLFKEGMIRNFIDDDQYDEIIEKAIAYHSLYKIPNNLEPSLLKQVLLIRDSDKLDNFRVKNIESIQTLFSISDADFYSQRVSQNILKDIEKALLMSDLGLTPTNDGKMIRLVFPELTEERRKELVKDVKKKGENAKVAVRNIRRDAMDAIKKKGKEDGISEDEIKEYQDDVQKSTDKYVAKIDAAVEEKSKEILTV